MDFDRENPFPIARVTGSLDANWRDWSPELEAAYLQHLAGVERLEDATSLQLVINTAAGGSVAHLGGTLPNLLELNLNGSTLDSLRDLGTGFRMLQVLWVSRCGLKGLDGLNGLPALRELYAAYNDISDLQPVDLCQQLEILDVECNCILDTDAVLYLTGCSNLQTLTLAGNPAAGKQGYRQAICAVLPSLHCLDDEPVTVSDRNSQQYPHQQQQHQRKDDAGSRNGLMSGGIGSAADGAGLKHSSVGGVLPPPPPPPLKASATAAFGGRTYLDASATTPSSGGGAATAAGAAPLPDADEVAFVVAGIKHARVGVDSHEFREIEMNLLVATADGTEVQLDVRPGTSALLPASASTWVRTLRSSREGSLAALRASAAAAAASAAARTGSPSPASPCSASPVGSRPTSSQQPQLAAAVASGPVPSPPTERWAVPAGPGAVYSLSSSLGGAGGAWRPGSGTGVLTSSCGGAVGGGFGASMESSMRPGSGGYRPGTGRPYSARPGTSASFSARLGTSASTGAAPVSASVGLYWAKNRIGGSSAGAAVSGGGTDGAGGASAGGAGEDADATASSSKLTLGSDTTFGGSFARDLRKWKGAAVRAAAAAEPSGGGGTGLSSSLLRGGQLDHRALLEELKRWKLETADKVLFVDSEEAAIENGWAGADQDRAAGLSSGGAAGATAGGGGATKADILRLTVSQDGCVPELGTGYSLLALMESRSSGAAAANTADAAALSPAVPDSPLQPPRPPPGAVAAGRRKMVLAKVLRDIETDTIASSGVCISEILAGLRPVHMPSVYGSGGGAGYTPGVAWGAPPGAAHVHVGREGGQETERERSVGKKSAVAMTAAAPGQNDQHQHNHQHQHHHNHHHHHHAMSPHLQQPQQQQQQQKHLQLQQQELRQLQQQKQQQKQGVVCQRPASARSVSSSAGYPDFGGSGTGAPSGRPSSRDDQIASAAAPPSIGNGGAQLQRQRSASRAPGLPAGPSAPAAAAAAAAGARLSVEAGSEMDARSSHPNPPVRIGGW